MEWQQRIWMNASVCVCIYIGECCVWVCSWVTRIHIPNVSYHPSFIAFAFELERVILWKIYFWSIFTLATSNVYTLTSISTHIHTHKYWANMSMKSERTKKAERWIRKRKKIVCKRICEAMYLLGYKYID